MSVLSRPEFHDEEKAFEHVETMLWPEGPVCPHCGCMDRIGVLKGQLTKANKKGERKVRHGLKKCYDCSKQFTVRKGTIFEESHLPMHKWLQAMYLMVSSKKGISSHQMARTLEVTVKTAWFLTHRIREAMCEDILPPMGGSGKTVEVDESFIGRMAGIQKGVKGQGTQNTILTLIERGGISRSFHITSATYGQIVPIMRANINRQSELQTDEARVYVGVGKEFARHGTVHHRKKEYARGSDTTNTVEGFFGLFKRGFKGIYQHCAEHHLHRYLTEYDFRYSNRVATGCNDSERADRLLMGVKGKRLTYRGPATV